MGEHLICMAPQEIQNGDLLAYLAGDASALMDEHLDRCPTHRQEAAELFAVDGMLDAALFRAGCPAPDDLLLYQAGFLSAAEADQIRAHLQACADCRAEMGELMAVQAPAQEGTPLHERLVQAGKQALRAILISSPAQPAGLAVRGAASPQRQYRAGDYQILLSVVPPIAAENRWQIEGQVLEQGLPLSGRPGDSVQLLTRVGDAIAHDVVDDFGYFVMDDVSSGRYQLHIDLFGAQIFIENLDVA